MNKLIISLLASLLAITGFSNAAYAAPFHAFCKGGVESKDKLEQGIRDSLAADASGKTAIKGCLANPLQFMSGLQQGDEQGAGPQDLAHLADYIHSLVLMNPGIDRYYSSCLKGHSSGADDIIMKCQPQVIAKGVKVYGNPKTGRMNLKLDCANPGLVPVAPPLCDMIIYRTNVPGEIRSHHPVYQPVADKDCHGERDVVMEHGTFRFVTALKDIRPGCIDRMPSCSYWGADAFAGRRHDFDGTIDDLKPGWHAVLVPRRFTTNPNAIFGICVEYVDIGTGARISTSWTAMVRSMDYKTMPNGQRVAIVQYQHSDLPEGVSNRLPNPDPFSWYLWERPNR